MPPDALLPPEQLVPPQNPEMEALLVQQERQHEEMMGSMDILIEQTAKNDPEPLLDTLIQQTDDVKAAVKDIGVSISKTVESVKPEINDAIRTVLEGIEMAKKKEIQKGEKGDAGECGEKGEPGERGEVGPPGMDGKDGKDGTNGKNGKDGAPGIDGAMGPIGPRGEKGVDGSPDLGVDIVKKLTELQGAERLSYNALKDLPTIWKDPAKGPSRSIGSRSYAFTELTDTPHSFEGQAGKWLRLNLAGTELEFIDSGVTRLIAGTGITLSPTDGRGDVTISVSGLPTGAFVQDGNSFGATATLGTNDTQALAFETDGVERMRITSGGVIQATGAVNIADGTKTAPSLGFTSDTDNGFYRFGANSLGIASGGLTNAQIDNSGVVLGESYASIAGRDGIGYAFGDTIRALRFLTLNGGDFEFRNWHVNRRYETRYDGASTRFTCFDAGLKRTTLSDVSDLSSAVAETALDVRGSGLITSQMNVGDGTSTIKKIISTSATLDFGNSVAAGSQDLTISVPGAVDGDVVDLGVPNAVAASSAGQTFSGFVSAADTVTIRRNCSLAAGCGDPPAGKFRVQVTKFLQPSPLFTAGSSSTLISAANIGISGNVACSAIVFFRMTATGTLLAMGDLSGVGTGVLLRMTSNYILECSVAGVSSFTASMTKNRQKTWSSIGFTKASGASTYLLYADGVAVNAGASSTPNFVNAPLNIGCNHSGAAGFSGNAAMAGIWQDNLSAAQMLALHNAFTLPGGTPKVIYYMNEGEGSATIDASGLGNNGVLTNTSWSDGSYPF